MKLWRCDAGDIDSEYTDFLVAPTQDEALRKWKEQLNRDIGWYVGECV